MKLRLRKYVNLRFQRVSRKAKYITLSIVIILTVASVIVVNQEVINNRVYSLIGSTLQEWSHKESNGLYVFSYDSLSVNTLREQVTLLDVSFKVDSSRLNELDELPKNIYNISSPRVFLDITSIWDVIFNDKLDFESITVREPDMEIYNRPDIDSTSNISFESGNLYLKINKYLDEFKIEEFFLQDGSISHIRILDDDRREVEIKQLDVYIDNLAIDTEERTTATDRVQVILKKPTFTLADGIHKIQMDSLMIDSDLKTINLSNVYVFPEYETLQRTDFQEINLYNFTIPRIALKGIDFTKAYRDNMLEIREIDITKPEIVIDTHKKGEKGKKQKNRNNSLPILLSQLFDRIVTNSFEISNAKMDIAVETYDKQRNFKVDNTYLAISDLAIDTIKYSKQNNHINYEDLSIKLQNYQLILPDSLHMLTAGAVSYHSDSSRLKISDIKIQPDESANTDYELNRYKLNVPELVLNGFSIKDYLQNHHIDLSSVWLSQPDLTLYQGSKDDSISFDDLNFRLPNDRFANFINSDLIFINNADFLLVDNNRPIIRIRNGDLGFKNFNMSDEPVATGKTLNSQNITLDLGEIELNNENFDQILIENFKGDVINPSFTLDKVLLTGKDKAWEFNGKRLNVNSFELRSLIKNGQLKVDSLVLQQGNLIINEGSEKKPKEQLNRNIDINFLKVGQGDIEIITNNHIIELNKINGFGNDIYYTNNEWLVGDLQLRTGKISYFNNDKDFQLGLQNAVLTKDELKLFNPYLIPGDTTLENAIALNANDIIVNNYDFDMLVNGNFLSVSRLNANNFRFKIYNQTPKSGSKKDLIIDWEKILPERLNRINIEKVAVNGPAMGLDVEDGFLKTNEFRVELQDFNTDLDGSSNLLNSRNITSNFNDVQFTKEDMTLKISQVSFDNNKKLITLKKTNIKNPELQVQSPLIFAKGLDLIALAESQAISGKELEIAGFNISYNGQKKKAEQKRETSLPDVQFSNIIVHQGKLRLPNKSPVTIDNLRGQLVNFDLRKNKNKLFFSDQVNMKAGRVNSYFNNGNDRLLLSGIQINNSGEDVKINSLNLIPQHDKQQYAYQFGHEKDWIRLRIRDISLSDFDIYSLLTDNVLDIKNIDVFSMTASVFRDKKLPFPENNRPPLPASGLKSLDMKVHIDAIDVNHADITYQELSEKGFQPGSLSFKDLNISINNITNEPGQIQENNNLDVRAYGKIEGNDVNIRAVFDLNSKNDEFILSGEMGEGYLKKFNNIMENNVFIRIDKGYSRGLTFNLKADKDKAHGEMRFYYRNLKVSLLDKQTNKTSGLDESLASFFANTFVINSNNPSLLVLKEGDIFFKRDKSKSLFNYWAKSFLSGVVSSIGVKNNKKEAQEALSSQDK